MLSRINELTDLLNYHTHLYYQENRSEISDEAFDTLLKELELLEAQYPEAKRPDSPTHRVGGTITKEFQAVAHTYPMLSLANTYSEAELLEWDERVQKGLRGAPYAYVCEIKFDGISLSMTYENGILIRGLTRGDGQQGDDITANVKTIRSLPLAIPQQSPLGALPLFEVRGEGFMPNSVFDRINQEREDIGEAPLANPRNAASGTFKMQDSRVVASRSLDAYLYHVLGEIPGIATHEESLIALQKSGFHVSPTWRKVDSIQEVIAYIQEWETKRHNLPCATDGIVVKINDFAQREELGFTAKSPRWAIAYKYKAESKVTKLENITYQVGRTGAITPVAELAPVELSMTTVRRATLHNADEITRLGLRIGDYVYVEKAGEIIPKVTGVARTDASPDTPGIQFPQQCPACQTELVRQVGEAAYYCPNDVACPPQVKGRIEHFIQRKALNIDSLGEGKLDILMENGLVRDSADLYELTFAQLEGLEKIHVDEATGKERKVSFKKKTVDNILAGIQQSKHQPFEKVLFGLGIRFVGETTATKLAHYFKTLDSIQAAPLETLLQVPDVGQKVAESVVAYFQQPTNLRLIQRLESAGLTLTAQVRETTRLSHQLDGQTFLYTGTFEGYSREELESTIEAHGGKLVSGVSKKLSFLIVGSSAGPSKVAKAEKLGVPTLSESEFNALLL